MWSDRFYFTWAPQPLRLLFRKKKFFFFLATLSLSLIGTAYATTRGMSFSHEAEREAVQLNVVFLPPFFAVLTMPFFFFVYSTRWRCVFFFFTALFVLFYCIREKKKKKSTQLLNIGYSLYHDWAFWRTCIRPSFFFLCSQSPRLSLFRLSFFFFQFLLPEHDSSSALH